ncbi:MAG TPA: hypothetical protein VFG68_20465 [Fimbriiglobus sp.]|nr:hypothetical protein [Fimbriiglobus sp.]
MVQTFERSGIRFQYPANWRIEAEDVGDGWTVTLQSQETAFALVSLRPDADSAAQVADEALAALRAEYPDLDAEPVLDDLAGQPAVGHDIDFLTLDTAILCRTRCIETAAGPLLVMGQTSEYDREQNEPVLRAICASLQLED